MGNQVYDGVPQFLAKNWQEVSGCSHLFKNKLTHQYTERHVIEIQQNTQIQSFKSRMKQSNPYICRVLFYHQYSQGIYHVYTEQMNQNIYQNAQRRTSYGKKMFERGQDRWMRSRYGIIEAFWNLAQIYGFMKICRQMIGCDNNGGWRVWINPNPCYHRPWYSVESELQMLESLFQIIKQIQQQNNIDDRQLQQSLKIMEEQNQHNFPQILHYLKTKLEQKQIDLPKSPKKTKNKTMSYIDKAGSINFEIDINNGDRNRKSQKYNLQKMFNPTVCETSRDSQNKNFEENKVKYGIGTTRDRPISYANKIYENNIQIEDIKRRGSDTTKNTKFYSMTGIKKINMNKQKNDSGNITKVTNIAVRVQNCQPPQNQKYKYNQNTPLHNLLKKPYPKTPKNTKNTFNIPHNKYSLNISKQQVDQKHKPQDIINTGIQKISPLAQYIQPNSHIHIPDQMDDCKIEQIQIIRDPKKKMMYKSIQNSKQNSYQQQNINNKNTKCKKSVSLQSQGLPNSYMSFNSYANKIKGINQSSTNNNPNFTKQNKESNNKTLFEFYYNKFNPNQRMSDKLPYNPPTTPQNYEPMSAQIRPRKNTKQIMKQQFQGILDAPVQQHRNLFQGTNLQFREEVSQHQKTNQMIEEEQNIDKETEMIREKVQKKKATFAHLKMEVMKMLQS